MLFWTEREECDLERLRLSGMTSRQIADATGRTYQAVRGKLRKIEAIKPSWLMHVLPLVGVPHRRSEVAERLGIGVGAVKRAKRLLRMAGFDVYRCKTGPRR